MHRKKNILLRYWLLALFFTAAGLLISLYSAHSHYQNYTDPLYSSFCAISKSINCDTVAQSPWSIMLGIPVAWWGILFYLFFLLILLTENRRNLAVWRGFLLVMLIASAVTLGLAGIAVWKIKSLCLVCLATYAVTFGLTYTCWIGKRRCKEAVEKGAEGFSAAFRQKDALRNYSVATGAFCGSLLLLYGLLPHYWLLSPVEADISNLSRGLTEGGHPWIGAEKPQLTITQFSDYQCFQCSKMYFLLRQFLIAHPDTLRLVHRHYPLDHKVNSVIVQDAFHQGSGNLAKVAILAAIRNKFWQTNDLLYSIVRKNRSKDQTKEISLQEIADKTGLGIGELSASLSHPAIAEMLRRDIWDGMKLGIIGTPAFEINGQVYQGHIPAEILKQIAALPKK